MMSPSPKPVPEHDPKIEKLVVKHKLTPRLIFLRTAALLGVIGIGVALGAIFFSQHVDGWLTGLIIGFISVMLTLIVISAKI